MSDFDSSDITSWGCEKGLDNDGEELEISSVSIFSCDSLVGDGSSDLVSRGSAKRLDGS